MKKIPIHIAEKATATKIRKTLGISESSRVTAKRIIRKVLPNRKI